MKQLVLFVLLVIPFSGRAANGYVVGADPVAASEAYSRAADLQALKPSVPDELRIWTRDFMTGRVVGFVISSEGVLRCSGVTHYNGGVITVGRIRCRAGRKGKDALKSSEALRALNGRDWSCPTFDGYEVLIHGVRNGKLLAFHVSNPNACSDVSSKAVVRVLDMLW
jgi:hypothetical protein